MLSESMTGPIDMDNLEIAKEVLRQKFIVGLLDNKRGSFARFDHYFKWKERYGFVVVVVPIPFQSGFACPLIHCLVPSILAYLVLTIVAQIMRRNSVVANN